MREERAREEMRDTGGGLLVWGGNEYMDEACLLFGVSRGGGGGGRSQRAKR